MADSYSHQRISGCSGAPLSEPPDIRNWFSSYKYETFVLDTCENFGFSDSNGIESYADGQDKLGDFGEPRKIDENSNGGPDSSKLMLESSLQSQPLISEPPDIRNWYSSYVYESPEIYTSNGFTNFALEDNERLKDLQVTRAIISKEKVEKCGGSPLIVNSSELAVPQNGLTTGVVCCNGSSADEEQHENESLSTVMDFTESPSLSSEPPHITNWFPDYISDCSVPVASDGVDVSLCKVREFEEDTFADGENNLEEAPIIATTRDAARPSVSDNVDTMEFEKYTHSIVEDTEERETKTKVERKEDHCNQGTPFSRKTSELGLNTKTLHQTEQDLKEAVYDSSLSKQGLLKTPKYEVSSNAEPELLAISINTRKCDGKVLEKLKSEVLTERSSLAEDVCQPSEPTICVPDHKASGVGLRRTPIQGTGTKEIEEISEDGFIMTKKRKLLKKPGKENSLKRPEDTLFTCSRSNNSECGNVEGVERKVLAETTNVQCVEANGVTGKWRCPQKSKPYRGPPMRQLRLEQWVHKL